MLVFCRVDSHLKFSSTDADLSFNVISLASRDFGQVTTLLYFDISHLYGFNAAFSLLPPLSSVAIYISPLAFTTIFDDALMIDVEHAAAVKNVLMPSISHSSVATYTLRALMYR
jgi:hypothetical protein